MGKEGLSPLDPSSFSRPELAVVNNISLNLTANFDKRVFSGFVELTIKKVDESVNEVILDVRDLTISKIIENDLEIDLKYTISDTIADFGSKLTIQLPKKSRNVFNVVIHYETSANASGLQWLTPEQTSGKQHPFLFSQFQAIHARSFLPCQDTPSVKTKYSASISAPPDLTVVMSAVPDGSKELEGGKIYHFVQTVPIPAYLIAIAIGALKSKQIGPRSHVWAEKEVLDEAVYEFAETEHQLKTAEDICGPYVWGIYDLLVLPPSFPYGGMENPCLTFVTPTLLAGDRSLADVIAHEIAHSWTGNLITNRNFEHFWLNEGFTVFVERKILGRLSTSEEQDFAAIRGLSSLKETIENLGADNPLTKLVVDLKGVHPDDAFSTVPYEKGQTFLRYLEELVGGSETFEPFLRTYFDNFKFKSIDSKDFKFFFNSHFSNVSAIKTIDWDAWFFGTGMPPVIPNYDNTNAKLCDNYFDILLKYNEDGDSPPLTKDKIQLLSTSQVIYLLQKIFEHGSFSIKKLKKIEEVFHFNETKNSEIKFLWLRIGLKAHWEDKIVPALHWVNEVGRMKFVRPLYKDLYKWDVAKEKAIENFNANKKSMMHVTAYTVASDLEVKN